MSPTKLGTTISTNEQVFQHLNLTTTIYKFKPSLSADLSDADLVISHAGTGSILETLKLQKPLIVIPNSKLMHNHQAELAVALHEEGLVVSSLAEPKRLAEDLRSERWTRLKKRSKGVSQEFRIMLEEVAGLRERSAKKSRSSYSASTLLEHGDARSIIQNCLVDARKDLPTTLAFLLADDDSNDKDHQQPLSSESTLMTRAGCVALSVSMLLHDLDAEWSFFGETLELTVLFGEFTPTPFYVFPLLLTTSLLNITATSRTFKQLILSRHLNILEILSGKVATSKGNLPMMLTLLRLLTHHTDTRMSPGLNYLFSYLRQHIMTTSPPSPDALATFAHLCTNDSFKKEITSFSNFDNFLASVVDLLNET
ncbi:N-acetylglucosaminyldiphosphodolichol N-acetylglucosaminyltransferase catalytic subunit alg13, partial [Chytridiales sp. JEL 0842]